MIYVKKYEREKDADLVSSWLANDPVHTELGITPADLDEGEVAIIHDENGPVMAVRFQKALRVAIQFNPKTPYRSAKVAKEVVQWFKDLAKNGKFSEVIIRPGGKAKSFAEKLG